jgi:hypothetical protein
LVTDENGEKRKGKRELFRSTPIIHKDMKHGNEHRFLF